MGKNVLVISTSPRTGSNSELLANEFARGAKDAGNEVEIISLKDKDIKFCRGCFACQKTKRCVIRDDADRKGKPFPDFFMKENISNTGRRNDLEIIQQRNVFRGRHR